MGERQGPQDRSHLFLDRADGLTLNLDALHGDLGVVASGTFACFNSGETAELLEVLPHLKRRGTGRIAIVGRAESSLARGSDVVLVAGGSGGLPAESRPHRQHGGARPSAMPSQRCGWNARHFTG